MYALELGFFQIIITSLRLATEIEVKLDEGMTTLFFFFSKDRAGGCKLKLAMKGGREFRHEENSLEKGEIDIVGNSNMHR